MHVSGPRHEVDVCAGVCGVGLYFHSAGHIYHDGTTTVAFPLHILT